MILLALLLIIGGALAIPSLIAKKNPNAKEMLDKIVPFQGIIGIVLLVWGLISLIVLLTSPLGFSFYMSAAPIWGILILLTELVAIGLGAILGYGLIAKYALSKNADAARSGEMVHLKLVGIQVPLGIAGIVLGILILVFWFIILPSWTRGIGM
ncbi:MAG TPA: hypothetical protein VGN95_07030 [Pyrinomonadaceae bacterium]|jgi:hypothetical protein|nr:hypothetical protein [Pyrinomonadaceae bacterium]